MLDAAVILKLRICRKRESSKSRANFFFLTASAVLSDAEKASGVFAVFSGGEITGSTRVGGDSS